MTATFPRRESDPVAAPEVKDLEGRVAVLEEGGGGESVTPGELEAEEAARVKGDGDEKARAVAAEKALGEADAAEAKARAEADTAEATSRANADKSEKEAREKADSDEAKARKEADESETGARKAADTTLTAAAAAAQATANAALPKAGGTMLGVLTLAEDPKSPLDAATRKFVLDQYAAVVGGAPEALDTLKELGDALKAAEESGSSADKALTKLVEGKLAKESNLSDLPDKKAARDNLELGSAATKASGDFDAAGSATTAEGNAKASAAGEVKTEKEAREAGVKGEKEAREGAVKSEKEGREAGDKTERERAEAAEATKAAKSELGTAAAKAVGDFDAAGTAKAVAGAYRRVAYMPGQAGTTAEAGPKYICNNSKDITAVISTSVQGTYLIPITAADLSVSGLTTKLRIKGIVHAATAPKTKVTLALYSIAMGASVTAAEIIEGSAVTIEAAAESPKLWVGNDFSLPKDGIYLLGYTLSAKPEAGCEIHAYLELHYV